MATSETTFAMFGTQAIASAGTAEQLIGSTRRKVKSITLMAYSGNTGQIFYGGSDVDSSTQNGLDAGETVTINAPDNAAFDASEIWIDSGTSSDGADFVAYKA